MDYETFKEIVSLSFSFLYKVVFNQLSIKDMMTMYKKTEKTFQEVREMEDEGNLCAQPPQCLEVDPNKFAVSICTIDGQRINLGNHREKVTQQSISAITNFLIAEEEVGSEELLMTSIGCEPSGKPYNHLELKETSTAKIAHNPMINSGSLMSCCKIFQDQ